MPSPSLPNSELLRQQSAWLAPARARLLRRVRIAGRRRVLDLACGYGTATAELVRRCGGRVVALDRNQQALNKSPQELEGAGRVCGDAQRLPFRNAVFDLVFCQFALLWLDAPAAVREARRVLRSGGALVAIEPDYGGLIEHPPQIAARELWLRAIARSGGDPRIGRKLPGVLRAAGFEVHVDLLDRLEPPSPARWEFLRGLPLESQEICALQQLESADSLASGDTVVHLPIFLITAMR